MLATLDLRQRLRVFLDAGLLTRLPTRWQLRQGELEMAPYVTSTDATAEEGYDGAPLGHPVLRQPLILSQVGPDHFRIGSALGCAAPSVCTHLQLTYHRGMPVFDLQVLQTHEDGLARLRRSLEELHAGGSPAAQRRLRIARLILKDAHAYHEQFLGEGGWIARAERFDYATPGAEGSAFPPEFFSLVAFLEHCASAFPATPGELGWRHLPAHLVRLAGRRFREGRGQGWFAS
jgi:hypothetical protein